MISHRFLVLLLLIASLTLTAQEYPKQIQLHPDIGDTLDLFERAFFDLYSSVDNFQYATFEQNSETIFTANIFYLDNDTITSKSIHQPITHLETIRKQIEWNRKKFDSAPDLYIRTLSDKNYV